MDAIEIELNWTAYMADAIFLAAYAGRAFDSEI
jgi:hypothetical protein